METLRNVVSTVIAFLILAASVYGDPLYLKDMQELFKKNVAGGPYTFMQTPRSGFDVGTIYLIADKTFLVYSRPEDCFTKELLTKAQDTIKLPTFAKEGKFTLDIGLKILPIGPVTKDVETAFKNKKVSSITVAIPELKSRYLTIKDLQQNLRTQTDRSCAEQLSKHTRYVIVESLYAPKYTISFISSADQSVNFLGGILKVLFPTLSWESNKEYKGEISFENENMVVAYKALKLKDVLNFAATEELQLENLSEEEINEYLDLINKD
ncbi:MAG TPA: hypothetical protein VJ044_00270 [Candidatus Hodarchaeales archaeon]|nr:hypothetical protein [Candidatus Hodarchaeales archaeon]